MNLRLQHIENFHISKLFNTDLHLFELSVWLHSFGLALFSVFIPIILLKVGLSIKEVLVFYILFNLIDVPLNIAAKKYIEKRGARNAIIVSTVAIIVYLVILYNLRDSRVQILALAVALAFYDAFFWVGHLYIFGKAAHKASKLRDDIGILRALYVSGSLVAPLVGAYIFIDSDQKTLIFFSTIVLIVSMIPLYKIRHMKFLPERRAQNFRIFFKHPAEKINFIFITLAALRQEVTDVLWPLFIFVTFFSLKTVAAVPMFISLASLVLIFISERLSLKRNIYKMVAVSSLLVSIIWIMRMQLLGNIYFGIFSVFVIALLAIFIDVPLEIAIFQRARETDVLASVTYMNLLRMAARAVLYIFLLAVLAIGKNIFSSAFLLVVIILILQFVMSAILAARKKYLTKLLPADLQPES